MLWCGVQHSHSLRKEALPEPAGAGVEASVKPARWGESKNPMVRMGCIPDSAYRPA